VQGDPKIFLHQAIALTADKSGRPEHVLGIHTDVSYIGIPDRSRVSFINIQNPTLSYYNLHSETGKFDPAGSQAKAEEIKQKLSEREYHILQILAQGKETKAIAQQLNISEETVRTHRKNMLRKTGCNNSVELIASYLVKTLV
jgi:DNA-binding NarL/FixJ family response regulator